MQKRGFAFLAALAVAAVAPANQFISGPGAGFDSFVHRYDGNTGLFTSGFNAFPGFTGGVRVATGDVNGDGVLDLVAGADAGAPGGHVRIFSGQDDTLLGSFFAYSGFSGGVRVAAGDVNGDGTADIITGAGAGGSGGHVKVFDGQTHNQIQSFFSFTGFTGGVNVASGDVNRDGFSDVIVGADAGAPGGHVKVFSGKDNTLLNSFFAFSGFDGGVFVGGGDLDGDGHAEIVVGAGAGAPGGHVKVFDGATNSLTHSFFAYTGFNGGVRVAAGDVDGDGRAEIVTGSGAGAIGVLRVFEDDLTPKHTLAPYGAFDGGIFVAAPAHQPVPEPATLIALGVGLAAIARKRRRR